MLVFLSLQVIINNYDTVTIFIHTYRKFLYLAFLKNCSHGLGVYDARLLTQTCSGSGFEL